MTSSRRIVGVGSALACAALALAVSSPRSLAAVSITATEVTVSAPGASAVVTRDPFRISFRQAGGEPALAEVATTSAPAVTAEDGLPASPNPPAGQPQGPIIDPLPPGGDNQSTPTLYSPLSFLVGSELLQQYDGGVWGGDLLSGERGGVAYSAQVVLDARPAGAGARLLVSTDDPTGRRLAVTIAPLGPAALRVSVVPDPATGVVEVGDSFASGRDEAFYGFGGRHAALNQRGQVFSSFVAEENVGGTPGQPASGPGSLFPNGPEAAYYPQAQFISSRPYGFLLAQSQLARFKLDADRPDAWNVTVSAPSLDYVVAPGSAPRAIDTLTALAGRDPPPPRWALGPMLDREVQNLTESESDYEANVTADLANLERFDVPLTAYRLEGWRLSADNDGLALPSNVSAQFQQDVFAELRRRNIHPLVYMRSWIQQGSAPAQQGLLARMADGQPYYTTGTQAQAIGLLDFTNPAAVSFWQAEVAKALDLGADGFEQDFGEEVLLDMHFADGETGATMHNAYPILYARATREEFARYEREHPGRTLDFYIRAGYSGLPGTPAYESANWGGDETTDFGHASGLASLATDMLNRAINGAYGYATDIGGYADYNTPPTTKELFLRWAEWAALTPVFRLHGAGRTGTHTPWSYDLETVNAYNAISRLHLAAVPLITRLWREAYDTGMPITRPLWLAFPGDAEAAQQDQEWMLGDGVLVAPVVTEGATSRLVYFPTGCWREPDSGLVVHGPRSETVPAPLTVLPYFFRCGTQPFTAAASAPAACTSERAFVIHVRLPRRARVRSTLVTVAGHRVATRRHRDVLLARIDLRRLPAGREVVRVVVRLRGGRAIRQTRRYRTCAPGHRGAKP